MSKNHYWVLLLDGEEPEIFTSWDECNKKNQGASRAIPHGFPTEEEAIAFKEGKWRGNPISKEAETWLAEYKAKEGQLIQDIEPDASDTLRPFLGEYPRYCVYVDGSYNSKSKVYGFGTVFIYDGKIETFYGSGNEENLINKKNATGELLACMEAIKHAIDLKLPEITIVYDNQLIQWAYCGCGTDMLTQAAGQYIYDAGDKIKITVKSIIGRSHQNKKASDPQNLSPDVLADKHANALADRLARKGAGV